MKTTFISVLFFSIFIFNSCKKNNNSKTEHHQTKISQEAYIRVGYLNADNMAILQLETSTQEVLSNWQTELSKQLQNDIVLNDIHIEYQNDIMEFEGILSLMETDELSFEDYKTYLIIATNSNRSLKAAYEAHEINGDIYIRVNGPTRTVACVGCAIGCTPRKLGSNYVCYPQCGAGYAECIKTETIVIENKLSIFGTNYISL